MAVRDDSWLIVAMLGSCDETSKRAHTGQRGENGPGYPQSHLSSPRQFCPDCIIATAGYDFQEGHGALDFQRIELEKYLFAPVIERTAMVTL